MSIVGAEVLGTIRSAYRRWRLSRLLLKDHAEWTNYVARSGFSSAVNRRLSSLPQDDRKSELTGAVMPERTKSEQRLADMLDAAILRHQGEFLQGVENRFKSVLVQVGIDVEDPQEQQADFAHLRRTRMMMESVSMRAVVTIITVAVTGIASALYFALRGLFTPHS